MRGCRVSRGKLSTAADYTGTDSTSYNPPVAEDKNNEEEKFDFTSEGEGYISLDEARMLAIRTASQTPGVRSRRYRDVPMAFEVISTTEDEETYDIVLSYRPQGDFTGTPGQEHFIIAKHGEIILRQVWSTPKEPGGLPILPISIGVVVVGIIAAVGAVFAMNTSGSDRIPVAAVSSPIETDIGTKETSETPTATLTLNPTEAEIGNDLVRLLSQSNPKSCLQCNLAKAGLREADLNGAYLRGVDLTGANLTGADLNGANLTGANLAGANLTGASLNEANLSWADLTGADLTGAYLGEANLTGVNLTGADLTGASLFGADLSWANLTGANLSEANLTGANLSDAILDGVTGVNKAGALNVPAEYLKD